MLFSKKVTPLLSCEIRHVIEGRIRFSCRALKYLAPYADEIRQNLENLNSINAVKLTTLTHNILIHFDPEKATFEEIQETVESIIGTYSLIAFKEERKEKAQVTVKERKLQEEPISEFVKRVSTTAIVLLYAMLRKKPPATTLPLFQRLTTVPAMTSISLSLPIFESGLESLRSVGRPNADTLTSTAVITSLLAGRDFSALIIIFLADIAELLTAYSLERTRKAIREVLSTGEDFVYKEVAEQEYKKVSIKEIAVNDTVMIPTGDKISVDGIVVSGEAAVDQSSITGEYLPVKRSSGEQVFAGTVVKSGSIVVKTNKVGDNTAISRIVHLVEEAAQHKASIQTFADKFSSQFLLVNFLLAIIVYAITRNFGRALNMLIIDYSCGVRLSTATAFSSAICTAARNGILLKGSNYLEMLSQTDTLVLDKTGTITEGKPQVSTIIRANNEVSEREIIELAAACEETSNHPLASAIINKAQKTFVQIPKHSEINVFPGMGVETYVEGKKICVGNLKLMKTIGVDPQYLHQDISRIIRRGENVVYVARDNQLIGILGIQDTLRENMKKALNRLRMLGIDDIILLTGDVEQHAEIMTNRMSMDSYKAEMLPEDKAEVILKLQSKGIQLAMVGDGINDAPSLAYADIGIAMGSARTDVAMEAADINIVQDNPLLIPATLKLSKKTMSIIRQNFSTAIGLNTVGIVLASVGVLPVFWGAVLHNSITIAVVMNSARLLFYDIERG